MRVALGAAAAGASSVALPLPLPRRERVAKPKSTGSFPRRLGAFVVSLPDHPWLDRLVRGRAWIPVLGILLAGIVATQVEILKLGAAMGQALEQTTTLTNQNEQLRDSVATLGDDQRIERLAGAMGMVLPPPGAVGYLAAGPGGNVSGALANIHSPDPSAFVALTPRAAAGDGALVTGAGTSTLPPVPGAPAPPPAVSAQSSSLATGSGASTAGAATTTSTTTSTSSSGTSTGNSSTASGSSAQAPATTTSQSPATTSQAPATTGPTGATGPTSAAGSASTPQMGSSTGADQTSQGPATGAAAIQPATSGQQSSGG